MVVVQARFLVGSKESVQVVERFIEISSVGEQIA